jgi:hypothetical protein
MARPSKFYPRPAVTENPDSLVNFQGLTSLDVFFGGSSGWLVQATISGQTYTVAFSTQAEAEAYRDKLRDQADSV